MKMKQTTIIIMISTILSFFGCGKTTKDDSMKSVNDFKNREIHRKMTTEIIDKTSDEELLQVIFDNLINKIPKDYSKEYETVTSWNKSKQAIYVIWCLEGEVNNGGFNQFYFNSSGQFAPLIPEALNLVGAKKFSELAKQANEIHKKEIEQITKHKDGTLEGFSESYEDNPLNDLDDKFYDLDKIEDLQNLQIQYIRKHKDEFID